MYDTWSKFGVHYIGIFACYIKRVNQLVNGVRNRLDKPVISLLSIDPMLDTKDENVDNDNERKIASKFNAKIHAKHFRSVLSEFYDIDLEKWAVCAIVDNCATNRKVARLLNLAHVGCVNHLFNLDV